MSNSKTREFTLAPNKGGRAPGIYSVQINDALVGETHFGGTDNPDPWAAIVAFYNLPEHWQPKNVLHGYDHLLHPHLPDSGTMIVKAYRRGMKATIILERADGRKRYVTAELTLRS